MSALAIMIRCTALALIFGSGVRAMAPVPDAVYSTEFGKPDPDGNWFQFVADKRVAQFEKDRTAKGSPKSQDVSTSRVGFGDDVPKLGWSPQSMAAHYGFGNTGYTGKDQRVAILSMGLELKSEDVAQAFGLLGVSGTVSVTFKSLGRPGCFKDQDEYPEIETPMDIQFVGAIAPGSVISVYRLCSKGTQAMVEKAYADAIEAAVDEGNHIVATSWLMPESARATDAMEKALETAYSKGSIVIAAAGDWGSSWNSQEAVASYPTSSPYVFGTGGTQPQNPVCTVGACPEVAWNQATTKGPTASAHGATGGGVSAVFAAPSWQPPDVSSKASAVHFSALSHKGAYTTYCCGDIYEQAGYGPCDKNPQLTGGTSTAAPLYAALFALANEARAADGRGPLTPALIASWLFPSSKTPSQPPGLVDVTEGNNKFEPAGVYVYDAKVGFDLVTGWGVPAPGVFDKLVGLE